MTPSDKVLGLGFRVHFDLHRTTAFATAACHSQQRHHLLCVSSSRLPMDACCYRAFLAESCAEASIPRRHPSHHAARRLASALLRLILARRHMVYKEAIMSLPSPAFSSLPQDPSTFCYCAPCCTSGPGNSQCAPLHPTPRSKCNHV